MQFRSVLFKGQLYFIIPPAGYDAHSSLRTPGLDGKDANTSRIHHKL